MGMSLARSLTFLTSARFAVNTSFRFVYPFLPAIGRGLGVSLERAGLLVSARSLAGTATPLVVATAGRGERRTRLIVLGLALFTLGSGITALTGVYAGALAGFVLLGFAKPTFDVSARSYLADRVPYARRARTLSVLELTWAGALLAGAPAAGWLIDRFGWRAPFWAFAAVGLAALAAVHLALEPDRTGTTAGPSRFRPGSAGAALLGAAALFSLAAELVFVPFGAWLEDGFGLSLVALGGAAVAIGVAELAGEGVTFAWADRLGKRRAVVVGLVISMCAFSLFAPAAGSLGWGLGLLALGFFGFEIAFVSALPLATEVMPAARTRYLAALEVAVWASRSVGAAAGPWLFRAGGLALCGVVAAGIDVVAVLVLLRMVPSDRSIRPPAPT
jgi:predicted MFS family arabinose efflux permease